MRAQYSTLCIWKPALSSVIILHTDIDYLLEAVGKRTTSTVQLSFTGYLVYYITDSTRPDNEWVVEGVMGDRLSATIRDLSYDVTYYFKVNARNAMGYGPMSPTVIFRTPRGEYRKIGAMSC